MLHYWLHQPTLFNIDINTDTNKDSQLLNKMLTQISLVEFMKWLHLPLMITINGEHYQDITHQATQLSNKVRIKKTFSIKTNKSKKKVHQFNLKLSMVLKSGIVKEMVKHGLPNKDSKMSDLYEERSCEEIFSIENL